MISIIIPVLNEAAIIKPTLSQLQKQPGVEIIVVDGGSQDNTVNLAQQTGVKVITVVGKNRAAQMNAGADIATGEVLLFLHIDTQLPSDFCDLATKILKQPGVIASAFELAIAGEDMALRWIEILVKLRSHLLSLPYGDQAIFLKKQTFIQLGGFADLPIMEDFEFIQRLKRQGKIAIASAQVTTSDRRWQKLGVWQTTLINQLMIAGYYLGISPTKLNNFYRSRGKKKS
ncbi:MAG: TIGR04283 family arsenosugar biosynthesis glycosyltransferase [Waterburya sp.]